MKPFTRKFFAPIIASLALLTQLGAETPQEINIVLRDRSGPLNGKAVQRVEKWKPTETAIIICDMWSCHPCPHATARLREMAPELNKVLKDARKQGILIIHSPSGGMGHYPKDLPARKKSAKYRKGFGDPVHWHYWEHVHGGNQVSKISNPREQNVPYPLRSGDSRCREFGETSGPFSNKQTEFIEIDDNDILTDDFKEIKDYLKENGYKNVILSGVHTDMCVIGRPFGLRAMVKAGYNTVLMRDLTDSAWNCASRQKNVTDHYTGQRLLSAYIEQYVCPTITSVDISGRDEFRFAEDGYTSRETLAAREAKLHLEKVKVEIESAFYGTTETEGINVTEKVRKALNGTLRIPIGDYNTVFSDPAVGDQKYLWIKYKIAGKTKTLRFPEGAQVLLTK
ncbi:MAG: isochorismatase family protein [Puniceicoccales bacterium]|jgi:nicotinamidase-related amidase|nr:isochorismatase family protein [Puniceicoccales bacterium]